MKKLSKIVALLLAGALTMLLFTACGGGGNDAATAEFEAKVEQAYMAKLNEKFGENFENDAAIKKLAVEYIEKMANKETLTKDELWTKEEPTEKTQNWVMICYDVQNTGKYVMSSYEAAQAETITPKNIDTFWSFAQMKRANVGQKAKFTALGVGVKTIDGKTYVAIGVRVEG